MRFNMFRINSGVIFICVHSTAYTKIESIMQENCYIQIFIHRVCQGDVFVTAVGT